MIAESPPHLVFRGEDDERGVFYLEIFPWKDRDAAQRAHTLPEVAAVWEPIGACCSDMEFPWVEQVEA